jgi:hypothetical protein
MFEANMSFTERGNVALSGVDFDVNCEVLWVIDDGKAVLEVTFNSGNYPAWQITSCNITSEDLAKHINKNLQGWYVRKGNIDGLNIDDDGTITEDEDCRYCQGECPNEPDDSEHLCDGFAGDIDGLYSESD